MDGEDVTDIDLWLYERSGFANRYITIVDIKNKRTPKATERIIWTKGLQQAIGASSAIVATTAKSNAARKLAKEVGVELLDGDAVNRLTQSEQLRDDSQLSLEMLEEAIRSVDRSRRSNDWRTHFLNAREGLIGSLGIPSANRNITIAAYFADQVFMSTPESMACNAAIRLMYFSASLVAINLDYFMSGHVFRSPDDRRQLLVDGLRYGQSEDYGSTVHLVRAAVRLARQYADNGSAVARQIELGFFNDAKQIAVEIIADHVSKLTGRSPLFHVGRELNLAAFANSSPPFDSLTPDTKSFLGVLLDFCAISRERFAVATKQGGGSLKVAEELAEDSAKGQKPLLMVFKENDQSSQET